MLLNFSFYITNEQKNHCQVSYVNTTTVSSLYIGNFCYVNNITDFPNNIILSTNKQEEILSKINVIFEDKEIFLTKLEFYTHPEFLSKDTMLIVFSIIIIIDKNNLFLLKFYQNQILEKLNNFLKISDFLEL